MSLQENMKKQSRFRTWFQAAWFALTNGYLRGYTSGKIFVGVTKSVCVPGLNCYSCPGAIGACPIGSLQAVIGSRDYRISLYVFGLLSAFGVFFGRLICGWMCPFGLVQDLLYKIKTKFKKKNLPGHKYLRWIRFVILIVFVILLPAFVVNAAGMGKPKFCEFICPSGMLMGGIPLTIISEGFRSAIGLRFWWKLFILAAVAAASVFYYRPFCKYLCPLGAVYGLFNPVSTYRLEIDHEKCIKCHACQKACGMDIVTFETPNSIDCIRCGACIKACPKEAITSTWTTARTKVISRCFKDDTASVMDASLSETGPSKADIWLFIIGMLILGGIGCFMSFTFLNSLFNLALVNNAPISLNSLPFIVLKLCASFILVATAVIAIVSVNRPDRLAASAEKTKIALLIHILAIAALVIGVVLNVSSISILTTNLLAFPATMFVYLIAHGLGVSFRNLIQQKKGAKPAFIISLMLIVLIIAGNAVYLKALYSVFG